MHVHDAKWRLFWKCDVGDMSGAEGKCSVVDVPNHTSEC